MTFGGDLNYRTEKIMFDVVKIPFPFNGILSRPALARFMAASHYAYNTLKMPGPMGVISISSDQKDKVIYLDKLYRDAVAAETIKAITPAEKKKSGKPDMTSIENSEKHTSSECC